MGDPSGGHEHELRLVSFNVGLKGLRKLCDPSCGQRYGA